MFQLFYLKNQTKTGNVKWLFLNSTSDQNHSVLSEERGSLETPLRGVMALESGTTPELAQVRNTVVQQLL